MLNFHGAVMWEALGDLACAERRRYAAERSILLGQC